MALPREQLHCPRSTAQGPSPAPASYPLLLTSHGFFSSFHYDWDTSSSSMNDPMVDSGKASDISVSSWPTEPPQWAPFPLLHQLSRQRPVSRDGEGCRGQGGAAGGCRCPGLHPAHPIPGGRLQGRAGSRPWLGTAAPAGHDPNSLCAAQGPLAAVGVRGAGAGHAGAELDGLRPRTTDGHELSFKTNHILFPRNELSEGIPHTWTIQSTRV